MLWTRGCLNRSTGNPPFWVRGLSAGKFYYPEISRPIMRNMELWKLVIKFRNEHSGKKLTFKEKELFYQDAHKVLEKSLYLLEKYTIPVTSPIQIAQVSAVNSDYSIALTIAEAFEKVGPVGVKMVVEGDKFIDELEVIPGMQLTKVKVNPMFITNCSGIDVFKPCLLILYEDRLGSLNELTGLINMAKSKSTPLMFIFSSCDRNALHDLIQFKLKGKLDIVGVELINPDVISYTSLKDISALTGTKTFKKNVSQDSMEEFFGTVQKAFFSEDEILFLGMDLDEGNLLKYNSELIGQYSPQDIASLTSRTYILLNNKVALIKIGGIDEMDIRKRMGMAVDTLGRAEQAVNHGLIVGDGRCLLDIIEQVSNSLSYSRQINGGTIVVDAMKFFYDKMYSKSESFYDLSREKSVLVPRFFGFDEKTKQYINLIADGILDPKSYFAQSLIFAKQKCLQYEKESGRDSEDDNI